MSLIIGLIVSLGFIILSLISSGDPLTALLSSSAAMIVLGGTFGAVLTQFGVQKLLISFRGIIYLVRRPKADVSGFIQRVAEWSNVARSRGSLALEPMIATTADPFEKIGLQMIIDSTSVDDLKASFGILKENAYRADMVPAEFWEAAGGYAPTIGVLGAVIGLIHVMTRLDHPAELGVGIATAFVATIYGVGSANMVFLPLHARFANFAETRDRERQIVIQGFLQLAEGKSGSMIRQHLTTFLPESKRKAGQAAKGEGKLGEPAGQAA